jgi:hypothetical protein
MTHQSTITIPVRPVAINPMYLVIKKAAMVSQENQSHMQERKAKKQCKLVIGD